MVRHHGEVKVNLVGKVKGGANAPPLPHHVRACVPIYTRIQPHTRVGAYAEDDNDMATDDPVNPGVEAPTSKGTRKPKRSSPVVRKDGKRSLNLRVDYDAHERLAVHALRRGTTISSLVEGFAREHLREFSIHRNAVASGGKD